LTSGDVERLRGSGPSRSRLSGHDLWKAAGELWVDRCLLRRDDVRLMEPIDISIDQEGIEVTTSLAINARGPSHI
jgi:hypothetical protein